VIIKDVVLDLLMEIAEVLLAVQASNRCVLRVFRGFAEITSIDDVE